METCYLDMDCMVVHTVGKFPYPAVHARGFSPHNVGDFIRSPQRCTKLGYEIGVYKKVEILAQKA